MKCDLARLIKVFQAGRRLDLLTDERLLDAIRWAEACPEDERTTEKAAVGCGITVETLDALMTLVHSLSVQRRTAAPFVASGDSMATLAADLLDDASPDVARLPLPQSTQAIPSGAQAPFRADKVECSRSGSRSLPSRLGPYLMGQELGRGAMGAVYLGRHASLGTEFAVKVMRIDMATEDSRNRAARFHREAAAVARMGKHGSIVTVHDFGQEGDLLYYSMERVKGKTLREVLRERRFSQSEAFELLEKVARAIHFAHEHGVIHRDLKPANILIREADGDPQVADFGLARDLSRWEAGPDVGTGLARSLKELERTADGAFMGTPAYMAPEQARGDMGAIDARTDVYSLGAVLYEMLVGRSPHSGQDLGALIEGILDGRITPPSHLLIKDVSGQISRPHLSERYDLDHYDLDHLEHRGMRRFLAFRDIDGVCMKALALDRGERYQSAAELADELARLRRGEPLACQGFNPEGKRLGSYQLHELVGQGSFSQVYRGVHVTLGTIVAVKVSRTSTIRDSGAASRCVAEAKLYAKVRHPNLVPIYDVGQIGDLVYYAMDFIPGRSMEVILKEGRLTSGEAATVVQKIATAVQRLHEQGIIHRNLKPGNVLIDQRTGEPILLESGLPLDSTASSAREQRGGILGTPAYMAPEQARGEPAKIGFWTDVYGLGAILYALLAGRAVHREADLGNLLRSIIAGKSIERPRRVKKDVPRGLDAICMKALAHRPEDRYASPAMFAEDIDRWRDGMPVHALRYSFFQSIEPSAWVAALLVAILVFGRSASHLVGVLPVLLSDEWTPDLMGMTLSLLLACYAAVLARRRSRLWDARESGKTSLSCK